MKNAFSKKNRDLLAELVRTDFKLRYQGSVLGYAWSLLRPLMLFTVLYFVFTKIFRLGNSIPYYPAYLLLGIVLWTFFVESTSMAMRSIVDRGDLIRKVSLPKYTIVLSTVFSAFVTLVLNLFIVAVFIVITKVPLSWSVLTLPIFLVELLVISLAVSFLLSALFVKYRDFGHIWEVVLQAMFYATPILYPFSLVPDRLAKLLAINPLAVVIQDIRKYVITPETITTRDILPGIWGWLLPLAITMAVIVWGTWYFKRRSAYFAEDI